MIRLRTYHGFRPKALAHAVLAEGRVQSDRCVEMPNVEDAVEGFVVGCVEEDEVEPRSETKGEEIMKRWRGIL